MGINVESVFRSEDYSPDEKDLLSGLGVRTEKDRLDKYNKFYDRTTGSGGNTYAGELKKDLRKRMGKKGIVNVDPTDGGAAKYSANEEPLPKKESVDSNIMGLLNKGIVQKGNVYSYNPTQAEADKETLVSNRQDLFHEMKGLSQRGYGAASDEMKSVREEASSRYGVAPEAFDTAFGKTDLGKEEQRGQTEKDRLAKYNEFYDRTTGAGSGLAGRKRKLYARNAGLKRAIQLRKKGFGSAAERLALGAASSLEAQGPAVASQGYLQAVEDNKAQANRQRSINQQLGVRLLAGLN